MGNPRPEATFDFTEHTSRRNFVSVRHNIAHLCFLCKYIEPGGWEDKQWKWENWMISWSVMELFDLFYYYFFSIVFLRCFPKMKKKKIYDNEGMESRT